MSDITETGSYSTGSYSLTATGLTCGTMYHYRAYSTNTSGTGTGSDDTFTTSSCPVVDPSPVTGPGPRTRKIVTDFYTQEVLVTPPTVPTTPTVQVDKKPIMITKTLRKGNKNDDVKNLQTFLNTQGGTLVVDGIFGMKTYTSVVEFQKKHNLEIDGVVGSLTWGVINKL